METRGNRSISKLIIIILLILILALVMTGTYLLLFKKDVFGSKKKEKAKKEYTVSLDEFVVNLKSTPPENNYLKISIALMYTDEKYEEAINSNVNKIRDIIINNLRESTKSDLLTDDSVAILKINIKEDINTAFDLLEVEDIYITDIIVQ